MRTMRPLMLVGGTVLLAMFALSAYVWAQLPAGEQVCTHWNAAGECDDYGNKFTGILLLPLVATGVLGLFAVIPRIEPRAANLAASQSAFVGVCVSVMLYLLAFHTLLMLELLGINAQLGTVVPVMVGLLLLTIGLLFPRMRSTYLMGVRTPWTLSSELSWRKTHQLGGWLFVLLGLLLIVVPFVLPVTAWVPLLIAGILGLLVGLTAYSYIVWRRDPNRVSGL